MTRQRLREGSIKWETNLSLESFGLKIVKKSEMLSFTDKVKSVDVQVPEKVKLYIDNILKKEIKYFKERFKIEIKFIAEPQFVIPEYSIALLDKNKKIINRVENINSLPANESKSESKSESKKKKVKKEDKKNNKTTSDKTKKLDAKKIKKKAPRTLWIRKSKKAA